MITNHTNDPINRRLYLEVAFNPQRQRLVWLYHFLFGWIFIPKFHFLVLKSRSVSTSGTGGGGYERERGVVLYVDVCESVDHVRDLSQRSWYRILKREKGRRERQMFLQGCQLLLVMSITFRGKHPHPKGSVIISQLLQVRTINAFRHALYCVL